MSFKFTFDKDKGLITSPGEGEVKISGGKLTSDSGMSISRNVTISTSPTAGVPETSGSLLQLKNKPDRPSINFHIGGNQYITQNSFFDTAASDWTHEESAAAFGLEFQRGNGVFSIVYAKQADKQTAVNGNGVFSTGLSLTGSNGAIGIGKKSQNGLSATLDVTGSNHVAVAVTGSVDIGGGAVDSFFAVPRLTTAQRNALTSVFDGQIIYNTSDGKFQGRASGAWVNLH